MAQAGDCTSALPSWQKPRRGRALDVHAPYPERRLTEGCPQRRLPWRELKAIGFMGRYTAVRRWVARRRPAETHARLTREDARSGRLRACATSAVS